MKHAFIEATFPELTVPKANQTGRGDGSTMKVAIQRAVGNLLKSRVLAHKRITVIQMRVSITEMHDPDVVQEGQP